MKNDNTFIYKWRVKAMLNNIKHLVKNGAKTSDIIEMIEDYIEFTDEIKK